jgi:hypothetical protein
MFQSPVAPAIAEQIKRETPTATRGPARTSSGARGDNAFRQDDVDPSIHQRHRKLWQTGDISVAPLREHEIASLHPTSAGKSAQECREVALGRWCSPQEARIRSPCCARAASGHAVAAPPMSVAKNVRRSMWLAM